MSTQPSTPKNTGAAFNRFAQIGLACLLVSACTAFAALVVPIAPAQTNQVATRMQEVPEIKLRKTEMKLLMTQVAGSNLIRPTQVIAAVKDTGAAKRLMDQLTLQSIVEIDDQPVAYVRIKNKGVRTVRAGQYLLDFMVDEINAGNLKLTLNGVSVYLAY